MSQSHYEIGEWVDYVRGITSSSKEQAMSAHLDTGCVECSETCEWLRKVVSLANSATFAEVPKAVVRRAESLFEQAPLFRFDTLFPLGAEAIFDPGYAPVPAGVRTAGTTDHVLYRAGNFTVDLRQESSRGSARISLVGQISRDGNTDNEKNRFPVAVFLGNAIITKSISNQFGEFSLSYSRRPDLILAIAVVDTGRKIEIPLTRSARGKNYINKEE